MKVATWNVNSLRIRQGHVLDWLAATGPDVLVLQETKVSDEQFPAQAFADVGYHTVYSGQKAYNGVAILSRTPMRDVVRNVSGLDDPQRRTLAATVSDGDSELRIFNVYVPNGSQVGSEKYAYKLDWLNRIAAHVGDELASHRHFMMLGDFNIAPADADVHDADLWFEKILCSTPEREALKKFISLGLVDTFRQFEQVEKSYSWWDYRAAGFRRGLGLRIDIILASAALSQTCSSCRIDKTPRGLERPSDHAPVIAEFGGVQAHAS